MSSSLSSVPGWLRSTRIRRGIALSAVVLATGGLVLFRAPAAAFPGDGPRLVQLLAGKNSASFKGPGAHGQVSLSHGSVMQGEATTVYADVRLVADPGEMLKVRAPITLAVVLDTSGSMSGEKIDEAKRSVLRLLSEMRDEDEISVVRYSDSSEVLQHLARVGDVRSALASKIRGLEAGGGTNIPAGLSAGLRSIEEADRARVRRVVLVSDGLDASRTEAERLARSSFGSGVTVSSLGIGVDFDERYMGAVAQSGHGNFAFVKDGAALASFLKRELEEASSTTIENARVKLDLPQGMHFVSATGADARVDGRTVELTLGSLFAADERRVIVELQSHGGGGDLDIGTRASWRTVSGATAAVDAPTLRLVPTTQLSQVEASRDGAVLASATSVIASKNQLEAAAAYASGDVGRADKLARDSERSLAASITAAPPAMAAALEKQKEEYAATRESFRRFAPSSEAGKASAKSAAAKDIGNLSRKAF